MSDIRLAGLKVLNSCQGFDVPFHVSLTESDLTSYFDVCSTSSLYCDRKEFVLCVWKCAEFSTGSAANGLLTLGRVLLDFNPDSVELASSSISGHVDATSISNITLYCPPTYCQYSGFTDGEDVVVGYCSSVTHIERVIIGAKTKRAYIWASSPDFTAGLVDLISRHTVLVRQGSAVNLPQSLDRANLWQQLVVLACSPVCQGRLTEQTEIILKDISVPEQDGTITSSCSDFCPLLVSDFALDILGSHSPLASTEAEFCLKNSGKEFTDKCVNVKILTDIQKFQAAIAFADPGSSDSKLDELSVILVNKKDAARLGIFTGSIFQLKAALPESTEKVDAVSKSKKGRKCHVENGKLVIAVINDSAFCTCDEITIFALPCVYFNMCTLSGLTGWTSTEPRCLLKKLSKDRKPGQSASVSLCSQDIPFASEVVISCINSPYYSSSLSYDRLLHYHFSKPRLLQSDEVFSIDIENDPSFLPAPSSGGLNPRHGVIYFKVKKLVVPHGVCDGCFVDTAHSSLLMESAIHDHILTSMHYVSHKTWKISTFLDKYVSDILSILNPFLANRARCGNFLPAVIIDGARGCGKTTLCEHVAARLQMHYYMTNCHDVSSDTAAATEARIKQCIAAVSVCRPCLWHLRDIDVLVKDRDGNTDARVAAMFGNAISRLVSDACDWPIIILATTLSPRLVSHDLHNIFIHSITIENASESARLEMLKDILSADLLSMDVSLEYIAQRSAGLVLADLCMLVNYTRQSAYQRYLQSAHQGVQIVGSESLSMALSGVQLHLTDFESALDIIQAVHSDAVGAPKIPRVTWEDVGGLGDVKKDILDTIQLPLHHPQLLACGLRRSGILLYGPPGTGKTLLAKAVATECSLNFLSVKGPELLNMYVGQSEENVREVFQRARTATPCVIFFDELDSLAPNRGRSGDSGGVMDRVVSQLLAEIDGLNKSNDVFVIGATNRPDLLDPALLRPGRFDKLVYLGVSEDKESQLKIVKALTRKFNLSPSCNLEHVVEKCSYNMTGADFYALCSDAMLNAMTRAISQIEAGKMSEGDGVTVDDEDFHYALSQLVPSLSDAELKRYRILKEQFSQVKSTDITSDLNKL